MHVQDTTLANVSAVNTFVVQKSGYMAGEGIMGAPAIAFAYGGVGGTNVTLPGIVPLPGGRVALLGPSDAWWVMVRQVHIALTADL